MSQSINQPPKVETTVTSYDAVNAFLISSIIVVGTIVGILFLIWLTTVWSRESENRVAVVVDTSFGNEKPEGFADDLYEPGVEEFPDVETPQLADALEALSNAVSSIQAHTEARDGDAFEMGKGGGFGSREGGPAGGGARGVPEYERWKIEYNAAGIDEYAKQLSFFNIDIGVVSNQNNNVVLLKDPGGAKQVVRSSREAENKVLFFVHEKRQLRRWDERIVRGKNVGLDEKFTVQFYPETTRALLRQAEAEYLQEKDRSIADVRRTRFRVDESGGGGYQFRVSAMEYR